ncbi:MAG TPA: succinyl-diaminopimelate desuccinylase [Bauldia sp.]|nr:succinyl-diaminopimelate desuccinylase [Bauldia sp.]
MTTPAEAAVHLRRLIACRSVTPSDAGAQDYLAEVLTGAGFRVERLVFREPGSADVANLFATIGAGSPHLAFAGHTDVVPPGDESRWSHPPFAAEVVDGRVFGRGAVDMKGGVAAFLAAALERLAEKKPLNGSLSFLITGDEEGIAVNGTVKLVAWAKEKDIRFDAALVGEPTSVQHLGDTVKIGRRGSLSGTLVVPGRQGHVAYPHLADNPVPRLARMVAALSAFKLDDGNADFQPSNLEFVGLDTDSTAFNVIPGEARARFNIRFNDHWSQMSLNAIIRRIASEEGDAEIHFQPGASDWFLTKPGPLIETISAAIKDVTGLAPEPSTGGGTSDARFFKDICPVVEFGLVGKTMHQIDESVSLTELETLTRIYRRFIDRMLG